MRYVIAKHKARHDDLAFRVYVSESLYYYTHGGLVDMHYMDLIEPKEQDTRTGDEIALDIIQRHNLRIEENEPI